MNKLFIPVALLVFSSCASKVKTTPDDIRNETFVEYKDESFFKLEYIPNPTKKCFPRDKSKSDVENMNCGWIVRDLIENQFRHVGGRLDIASYSISYYANESELKREEIDELIYLISAEVSKQSGYSYFTVEKKTAQSNCSGSLYQGPTYIYNTDFGATAHSTLGVASSCSTEMKANFVAFNNPEDLRNGLFYSSEGSSPKFRKSLYGYTITRDTSSIWEKNILDAWEYYYSSDEISKKLALKYNLESKVGKYKFFIKDKKENLLDIYKVKNK